MSTHNLCFREKKIEKRHKYIMVKNSALSLDRDGLHVYILYIGVLT